MNICQRCFYTYVYVCTNTKLKTCRADAYLKTLIRRADAVMYGEKEINKTIRDGFCVFNKIRQYRRIVKILTGESG